MLMRLRKLKHDITLVILCELTSGDVHGIGSILRLIIRNDQQISLMGKRSDVTMFSPYFTASERSLAMLRAFASRRLQAGRLLSHDPNHFLTLTALMSALHTASRHLRDASCEIGPILRKTCAVVHVRAVGSAEVAEH